jgi:GDP-L-fucose synthase
MSKILITGGNGLVGNAIKRLSKQSKNDFIFVTRADYDLTKEDEVKNLYNDIKPNFVIHTAAKVGGIGGNMIGQGDYFYQNILMNTFMIHYAYLNNVQKMLAFSSVCVFPDDIIMLKEDVIHSGPPFSGNFAYAHAKRMVDVQIRAYKSQYNCKNFCSIIPGNIYGTHDFYNLQHGHVIPSLLHKLMLAKKDNTSFKIWGDGRSLREFIFVDDLASILLQLIDKEEIPERLLISGFEQYAIGDIISMLASIAGFSGQIQFDTTKPNGQRNRQSDLTILKGMFPDYKPTDILTGLKISYDWFIQNYPNVRL